MISTFDPKNEADFIEISTRIQRVWFPNQKLEKIQEIFRKRSADKSSSLTLIARIESRIVGFMSLDLKPGRRLYAGNLYVYPEERRKGVANALIGSMFDKVRDFGENRIFAEITPDAPPWMRTFYESLGFLEVTPGVLLLHV
jgi:GNAT superfamily N-acetyltransferase